MRNFFASVHFAAVVFGVLLLAVVIGCIQAPLWVIGRIGDLADSLSDWLDRIFPGPPVL